MRIHSFLLVLIVSLVPGILQAQTVIPAAGVEAESKENWGEAIRLFRGAIAADPHHAELWVRIADIEARRGDLAACITALQSAVEAEPGAPGLYARLSQAYASAGLGLAALRAIEGALVLEPGRPDYLRAKATLATWMSEYRTAQDAYRRLAVLYPDEIDLALAFARVAAWGGDTDVAVREYKRYLRARADDGSAWLELAKAESWRGNYAGAIEALDEYRSRFGTTPAYRGEVAAVLASGGRPGEAEGILRTLLAQSPEDYELNLARTIALAQQHRSRDALQSLDIVRGLSADRLETKSAERVLRSLFGSLAEAPVTIYSDSDDLQVRRFTPRASVALQTGTRLSAGFEQTRLEARVGSGLEPYSGPASIDFQHAWAGASQQLGSFVLQGQTGYAVGGQHTQNTYGLGMEALAADGLRLAVSHTFAPFVVSPRTVDLGLKATTERAQVDWSPSLLYQISFDGMYQELSDGNRRWEMILSPRRTVARTARVNLDLGASGYLLQTTHDLDHGYYDPRRYEFYAATIYPYFKIRENVGLAVALAFGAQRDSSSPSFHFGGNVSSEATFGIYQLWAVKVSGSATMNQRLASGAFRGFGASAALVRRFSPIH